MSGHRRMPFLMIFLHSLLFATVSEAYESPFMEDFKYRPFPPFDATGATRLDAGRLRELANTTWYMLQGSWITYIDADGKTVRTKNVHSSYRETGSLEITRDGQFCITWKTILRHRTCKTIWKKGDLYIVVQFDKVQARMRVKPGNAENL